MVKQILIYSVVVTFMFTFYTFHSVSSDANRLSELVDIIDVAENKDMLIKSWSAYSKQENIIVRNSNEVENMIENIKKENPRFKWVKENVQNAHYRKVVGTRPSEDNNLDERIVFTSYEDAGKQVISITHQINGEKWNSESRAVVSEKMQSDSTYFTVRGTMNEAKNDELQSVATDLVAAFSGEVKEGLTESDFVSISAYNQKWDLGIAVNQEDNINLQIGVRNSGQTDSVNVTIGTPIITTEY
ncbi:YwmB family TATA-box binding protein [Halalkalibacter lacteus]|uniref:YwmB family TATA-box binding protein n=1 Tax=Halalkalibacter lacteus TaxID=3090663 RepID=UPI002FC692D4